MEKISTLIHELHRGNNRALARCITIVENELNGSEEVLRQLKPSKSPAIIGFTGPPGAGKSTLINSLISFLSKQKLRIGVIAIDPTSRVSSPHSFRAQGMKLQGYGTGDP